MCIFVAVKLLKKTDLDARRVVRTCAYQRSPKACYSFENDHHMEMVCQCFEDGCNTAPHSLSILSVLSTFVVASAAYFLA